MPKYIFVIIRLKVKRMNCGFTTLKYVIAQDLARHMGMHHHPILKLQVQYYGIYWPFLCDLDTEEFFLIFDP